METRGSEWLNLDAFRPVDRRTQRKPSLVADFGKDTTIHGIRHVTHKENHVLERLIWAFILATSLIICINLLLHILMRWNEGPVIVNLAGQPESIRNIPFPAVTICPETKSKTSIFNYTDSYHSQKNNTLSAEDKVRLEAISQICDSHMVGGLFTERHMYSNDELLSQLEEMAPNASDVLFYCKWRNEATPCGEYFQQIWTEEGSCFTFNMAEEDQLYTSSMSSQPPLITQVVDKDRATFVWSLDNGYAKDRQVNNTYPYHSYGAGVRGGLIVLLRLYEHDLDYLCRGPVQGFKVLLHLPNEHPNIGNHYFRVPLNMETFVTINPEVKRTAESLKHKHSDDRGCLYSSEKQLKYYKEYTRSNCEQECLANITMQKCGCVKFSMPREPKTPVCGEAKISCYNNAIDDALESNEIRKCNCLPSCNYIEYHQEISQAEFDYKSLFKAYKNPLNEFPGMMNARLTIRFKDEHFVPELRHELYSHADLLALCGGILAFFFGASMLSLLEVVHFCSTRILFRRRYYAELQENASVSNVK